MKNLFRSFVVTLLSLFAKVKIFRSHPILIGITGSVGKTSTKDAVVAVLRAKYTVKAPEGGYNSDIGVPMMILNQRSKQDSNPITWLRILLGGFVDMLKREHMDVLVVEMGVDKPGDMKPLTWLINPTIAVLTSINNNHVAAGQFSGEEDILREKSRIAAKQSGKDIFITNNDNTWIAGLKHTNSKRIRYGEGSTNEYVTSAVRGDINGIDFHVHGEGVDDDFHVPILGTYHVSVLVPAIIIGLKNGIAVADIQRVLANFQMPKGRMRLLEGVNGSKIIDSSYNASPVAVSQALKLVDDLMAPRKILCLGQMNELGTRSEAAHREVGRLAAQVGDLFILVGKDTQFIQEELLKNGIPEGQIKYFIDSQQAGQFLRPLLQEGDLVFAKGSQNAVRLERMIKEIMLQPERAAELLARQGPEWQ